MARFEDYLPGGAKDPAGGNPIDQEISDAQSQHQARQDDATPEVDWEQRYRELEKLNSRQAQTLGEYRKTIDEFIVNPTPAEPAPSDESPVTFSLDDFYDDPDATLNKKLESHPAIREARQIKLQLEEAQKERELKAFSDRHSDYADISKSPEFQNWVVESPTRIDLFQRGNNYDFSAADALFSLYKAEKGLNQAQSRADIEQAELVSSSGEMVPAESPKYSRSEYIRMKTRAVQGDLDAEDWIKHNAAGYRMALQSGNVRD